MGLGCYCLHAGIRPDLVLTSTLERALHTAELVTDVLGRDAPIESTWRLNERNHGALTGMSKQNRASGVGGGAVLRCSSDPHGTATTHVDPRVAGRPADAGASWTAVGGTSSNRNTRRRHPPVQPVLSQPSPRHS
ncbi:histidine phosphatase family protein [Sphingomonas sp. LR61]|uniref:histidine phosphatase family protein n=1 Tax=Sphingomonas sp. LR61 TaxID=3050234 RepID=UPI003FA7874F